MGELETTCNLGDALQNADVVYTDCWPGRANEEERERIERLFSPYRVTRALLERYAPDAFFLPCPPVHRTEEVDDDAMRSPQCRVYEAKEYLLHAQNAVLAWALCQAGVG